MRHFYHLRSLTFMIILVALHLVPQGASAATSPDYIYLQITNKFIEGTLSLNNQGHVLWEETVAPARNLWLYRNNGNTLIISELSGHSSGTLNNNDQAAWQKSAAYADNYCYSNGTITQMTFSQADKTYPSAAKLNNHGQMGWFESFYDHVTNRIAFFNNPGIIYLGYSQQHINSYPNFNNLGQIVWTQQVGGYHQVFLYDGSATIQITYDDADKENPKINDLGDIVWLQPGIDINNRALVLRRKQVNTTLTETLNGGFVLNNIGQIVWIATVGQLKLYSNGVTTHVGICDYSIYPGLNNQGQIAYHNYDSELMVYNHNTGAKITLDSVHRYRNNIQINDNGQVAWSDAFGLAYLATPKSLFGKRIAAILGLLLLD